MEWLVAYLHWWIEPVTPLGLLMFALAWLFWDWNAARRRRQRAHKTSGGSPAAGSDGTN